VDRPEPLDIALDPRALAAIGPFFALTVGTPEGPGWQRADSLDVRRWVEWGTGRLGSPDRVVAASLLYQGWAARLTSIYAGSIVLGGGAPDLSAAGLWYRYPPGGGAIDLCVGRLSLLPPDSAWWRLVDANLAPLAEAVRREVRIGRRLLWGNVASAMAGSLAALARAGHARLEDLTAAPWSHPPDLDGLGSWRTPAPGPAPDARGDGPAGADRPAGGGARGLRFRRTTCCLYERLPGAGRCGDCSLDA
jgi:hypothetical protein